MRLDTARRFALSLPETTEEPHFEKSSFRVRGKIFATVPRDAQVLHVHVAPDDCRALIEERPEAFEPVRWGTGPAPDWIRVNLPRADRETVCELLEDAWRLKAPKRLVTAHDASRARVPGAS